MVTAKPKTKRLRAIEEIQSLVLSRFPDARFKITPMPDSRTGTAIWTYTAGEWDQVTGLVVDRELDLLVDENVFLSVIPMPLEAFRERD